MMLVDDGTASSVLLDAIDLCLVLQNFPDRDVATVADELNALLYELMGTYKPNGGFR